MSLSALARGVRDDLGAPALFAEQALEHFRDARSAPVGSCRCAMQTSKSPRKQALVLVAGDERVLGELGKLGAARLVGSQRRACDFAPSFRRHFGLEVSDLVRQTPLSKRSREHLVEHTNKPRGAVSCPRNSGR